MRGIAFPEKFLRFGRPAARECQQQRGFSLSGQAPPDHVPSGKPSGAVYFKTCTSM
jgi:nicotinamide mononucleotide (NMN) deamidase PncC